MFNTFLYLMLTRTGGYEFYSSARRHLNKIARRLDLNAYRAWIVPIHIPNQHWAAGVINFAERRFEYFDSLGAAGRQHLSNLR